MQFAAPVNQGQRQAHQPLVSIGVPVFNGEQDLAAALQSVLAQDYDNLEIIISDNASTDGTEAICRQFAASDPRIRYLRNPINVGACENFHRVMAAATGKYFAWLAHDDLLSSQQLVRVIVAYLEQHSDVVLCTSALHVLDYQVAGSRTPTFFPSIAQDVPWPMACREFFRWPRPAVCHAIYGIYRREDLAHVPIGTRTYRGQPIVVDMEGTVLTALCARGRIVALPDLLRTFRFRLQSDGQRARNHFSGFDWLVLGLLMKYTILRDAWKVRLPRGKKMTLMLLALGNFFRANFRHAESYASLNRKLGQEAKQLSKVAAERLKVVHVLQAAINTSRETLRDREAKLDWHSRIAGPRFHRDQHAPRDGIKRSLPRTHDRNKWRHFSPTRWVSRLLPSLIAFFRLPSQEEKATFQKLYEALPRLRQLCEYRLELIVRLDAEAQQLRELIDTSSQGRSLWTAALTSDAP